MSVTAYQMCTRTVMDTSDPDIWFDADGVSSHALAYDAGPAKMVEAAMQGRRRPELDKLIDQIRRDGAGKPYDCVIGLSGGVDSTYAAMTAVDLGLRPLAVHFDSGWNSELAVGNIELATAALGMDLITEVVDWREMRDLHVAFLRASVANCDIPTDHAFPAVAFREAARHGVKYVISGANFATESVLPVAWGYDAQDARHLKAIHSRFGSVRLRRYPVLGIMRRQVWYAEIRGIRTVALLNYLPYVKADAKAQITSRLGWRDYGGKHHESVFTRWFQGYYLPTKFGFDKRLAHLSSLILSGQLTRDDALAELREPPYADALRRQDHDFVAKKLGLTTAELDELIARPPVDHLDYPNNKWLYDLLIGLRRRIRGS